MNPVDPRWLEILKASSWQTTSLALACLAIVVLINTGIIPSTDNPLWVAIPMIGLIVFGFLSLGSIGSAAVDYFKPGQAFSIWRAKRKKAKEAEAYIPHMSAKDREIIGYLLHHNRRLFQADNDAGYAAPLLSKGFINIAMRQGQTFDPSRVPFEVPEYVWEVFQRHRSEFPYKPPSKGETEVHPWAIHWMAR